MKRYYLPKDDLGKLLWLSNFVSKLATYAAKYGITAAEQTDASDSEVYFNYYITYLETFREFLKKITAFKNELRDGVKPENQPSLAPAIPAPPVAPTAVAPDIFLRITALVNRIKSHASYTVADGQDLGIEGPEFNIDLESVKPIIKIVMVAGQPVLKFKKQGLTAVEIHVKRTEASLFELLDISSSPEFTDTHALPAPGQTAMWKYKAIYRLKNERVGQWSDEVSMVVGG